MSQEKNEPKNLLPENAYRELKPGEVYTPIVSQETGAPEVTPRSVIFGLLMIVIFSAAATYIALKLGQGIETAIPIGILAVGFSTFAQRKSLLIENVNILAIGATSGIVVGGSVFVMPAIFMLGLDQGKSSFSIFLQIFLVPFLGAVLGVLFLIPFRRYFTHEMHGKLPFPEGTATTEILVAGEKGGSQAKVLVASLGLGIAVDYICQTFKAWGDVFTTASVGLFHDLTEKHKAVFAMNTSAAALGLGVIIGVKYASIIMAGSMFASFVLIPLFAHLNPAFAGADHGAIFSGIKDATTGALIHAGVRNIGIGAIFAAGVISILKMSPVIKQALSQMMTQLFKKRDGAPAVTSRLDRDIPLGMVMGMILALSVVLFVYFRFVVLSGEGNATLLSLLALALTLLIVFLFSAVSAWAVAMISVTPISGMTLTTLIIAALTLSLFGLKGPSGMLAILLIGGVVCTALSMSGSLVTQFKVGHWLGSTPSRIQWSNMAASALASLTVTAVIMLFAKNGFGAPTVDHPNPLPAPQASAMAAVANAFLGGQGAPWALYALGAVVAVIMTMLGISGLAFGLGMYLPIELNSPILAGAIVGWLIQKSTKDELLGKARNNKATLIASGFIAGGALAGVLSALTTTVMGEGLPTFKLAEGTANTLGLVVFLGLAAFLYWDACRAKAEGA